jgi:hypothetical protein
MVNMIIVLLRLAAVRTADRPARMMYLCSRRIKTQLCCRENTPTPGCGFREHRITVSTFFYIFSHTQILMLWTFSLVILFH